LYLSYSCTGLYSKIYDNVAYYGGGVHVGIRSLLEHSVVNNNEADGYGGGIYSHGGTIKNCTIRDNHGDYGGGVDLSTAILEDSIICSNESVRKAGGVNARFNSTIKNCKIIGNKAGTNGGGIDASPAGVINCLVYRNRADSNGGGIFANMGSELQNCTIVSNVSAIGGGGLHCMNDVAGMNCIIYFNTGAAGSHNYRNYGTGIYYESCCTTPALTGIVDHTGNIVDDPAFVNRAGGDLHIPKNSPCVDMGINDNWMIGGTDLDGFARIYNSTVDMGAYEYSPLAPFGGISVRCYEPKLKNKKKKGILKCTSLMPVLKKYLTNNYGIGMWDMETDVNVDGPRLLTAKNKKETVWIYSDKTDKTAKIIYSEKYLKKKHYYKTKLKYKLEGNIPVSNLVYVAPVF
jgi:predicted outer membrane repeat protein